MQTTNTYEATLLSKELLDRLTSINDTASIANIILEMALELTNAQKGSILLLNEKNELTVAASKGIDPGIISSIRVKPGDGIAGRAAEQKRPLILNDTDSILNITKKGSSKYLTDSCLCYPIIINERLLGVINIADKNDSSIFFENDLKTIGFLAAQTSLAIENIHLRSELTTKSEELKRLNSALFTFEQQQAEFITEMSHELRTPLNSITGAVYYLKEENYSMDEHNEFINIISDETVKLISLLQGLLTFSPEETGTNSLKMRSISIMDIADNAVKSKNINDLLTKNNISINLTRNETVDDIIGDKTSLMQSINYMIDGLTNYASAGDSIDIAIVPNESSVNMDLTLKGRTIPENDLSILFSERSLWLNPEQTSKNLKFYIAKKNIRLNKGSVNAYNTDDGIAINIVFPVNARETLDANIREISDHLLSFLSETMQADRCSLMLIDEPTGELVIANAIGMDNTTISRTRIKPGEKIAGMVALENKALLITDIENDPRTRKTNNAQYSTKSLLSVPLTANNKVIGVLNINNKTDGSQFNEKDLHLANVIAERTAKILNNILSGDLKNGAFKQMLASVKTLLNAKIEYKKNGAAADLVFNLARNMGLNEKDTGAALYASSLYDLGLTKIDDAILMKKDALSSIEKKLVNTHTIPAAAMLKPLESDDTVINSVMHHHERYDGTGYPDRLKGNDIPMISRILSVADAYTAMTGSRPYRESLSSEDAAAQIKAGAGTQFDPEVVNAFMKSA